MITLCFCLLSSHTRIRIYFSKTFVSRNLNIVLKMMKRVHLKIRWNDNSKNSETEKSPPGKTHLARSLIASVCFRSPLYPFTVKDNRVSVGRGEDSAATVVSSSRTAIPYRRIVRHLFFVFVFCSLIDGTKVRSFIRERIRMAVNISNRRLWHYRHSHRSRR